MKHKNGIENVILQLQKKETKMELSISATITRVTMKHGVCETVSSIGKNHLLAVQTWLQKKKKEKKRKEKVKR